MNYRHAFHAGNFADVFKHVLLGSLIAAMQRKDKPFLYLDTHGGKGRYDLATADKGDSLDRKPEWPDGVGRLWTLDGLPAPIARYVSAVRDYNKRNGVGDGSLRFYPGSPVFAAGWLREIDRIVATEMLGEECTALRREIGGRPRTSVKLHDGYGALRAFLPPPERRALVLVDPPFEATDEFTRVEEGVRDAIRRLPSATIAVWYPLTVRSPARGFLGAMCMARLAPTLDVSFPVRLQQEAGRLNGCGMVILNPPWKLDEEIAPTVKFLNETLTMEPGTVARIEWLVPEL